MTPASPSPSKRRSRRPLVVAVALLVLGIGAPSASAASVVEGSGTDAAGDAPSRGLDVVGATAVFNRTSGKLKATVQMGNKPPGDVDVQYGITQPGGACAPEVTLRTNVAAGKAQLYGSAGNVRKNATVTYADVGIIKATVTDDGIGSKGKINCFAVRAYGAGANHELRDTLGPVALAVRAAPPTTCDPDVDDCGGTEPPCDPEFEQCDGSPPPCIPELEDCGGTPPCDPALEDCGTGGSGVDTDGDGILDDFDGDGLPDDFDGNGIADALEGGGTGTGGRQRLSVRFYGVPGKLKRERSYDVRIRIRNEGDDDARKLKVRLTKKTGVAMSRRVASVSNVRAGKGVTVHVRVRLTSSQAKRTVRVAVTNESGIEERRSLVLNLRRGR
jgi:hypothetical protein